MDKKDKIEALQADLDNLKDLFSRKVNYIEQQISDLSGTQDALDVSVVKSETPEIKSDAILTSHVPDINQPVVENRAQETVTQQLTGQDSPASSPAAPPAAAEKEPESTPPVTPQNDTSKSNTNWLPPAKSANSWSTPEPHQAKEPKQPRKPMPAFSELLTSLILFLFSPLLKPLHALFPQIFTLYEKFRKEERLSIFFLTVGGVIATVLGFVFLLQYSFSNYLSEFAKIIFGYIVAMAIITTGWKISYKSEKFKDYGASLIGLGITLNYVCTYFISSYYNFVGDIGGFLLFGINTGFAYFLALKFETRIVATITYVGGAFTPFLLHGELDSARFYLSYLFLLSGAALHLSRKINWITLTYLSFLSTLSIFEYLLLSLGDEATLKYSIIGLIHAFFYLYVYYAIFSGYTLAMREKLNKEQIAIFVGSITLYLFNLYQYVGATTSLGIILLVNSLPFILYLAANFKQSNQQQRALITSSVATLLAISVPFLFALDVIGLIWAQESLLLLYFGFIFASDLIKKEAYTALIISTAVIIWSIVDNYSLWLTSLLNVTTASLLSIGVLLLITIKIIDKFKASAKELDLSMQYVASESLSFWMAATYFLTVYYLFPQYTLVSAIVPMLFLMYRGTVNNLSLTKQSGLVLYVLVATQIILSINSVGSFRFAHQTMQGKIALIETLALLAFLQTFFIVFLPHSSWLRYARKLRVSFLFILPLMLLPTIYRRAPEYFALALWASFALNYYIAKKTRHSIIQNELVAHYFTTIALSVLPVVLSLNFAYFSFVSWPHFIAFGLALLAFHQTLYAKIIPDTLWLELTDRFRIIYLFILPLIFLPVVWFNAPAYFSPALWLSFALTYFITKKTKYALLEKELVVHYFATIAISVSSVVLSQDATIYSFGNWPLFTGFVIALLALHRNVYENIIPGNSWARLTETLRVSSLLLLPLIFIPPVLIYAPDFVPLALWLSFAANYFIILRVDHIALRTELITLYFVTTAISIFTAFDEKSLSILNLGYMPIFVGLFVSAAILIKEGMLNADRVNTTYLRNVMTAWFYHSCISLGLIVLLVSSRLDAALLSVGAYMLAMSLRSNRLPALGNLHAANYITSMLLLGITALSQLAYSVSHASYLLSALIGTAAVAIVLYVVKSENSIRLTLIGSTEPKRENRRVIELWYAQILVVALYLSLIQMMTGDWFGPVTTIAFVIHGIAIIFQSLQAIYKSLIKLSVIMFAAASIKIFFYDLEGFTLIQKILAFTVIGMVMLVSAYYFNKIRNTEPAS